MISVFPLPGAMAKAAGLSGRRGPSACQVGAGAGLVGVAVLAGGRGSLGRDEEAPGREFSLTVMVAPQTSFKDERAFMNVAALDSETALGGSVRVRLQSRPFSSRMTKYWRISPAWVGNE